MNHASIPDAIKNERDTAIPVGAGDAGAVAGAVAGANQPTSLT
jgi:hypothetical protein